MTNTKKRNVIFAVLAAMLAGLLALMGVLGLTTKTAKADEGAAESTVSRFEIEDDLDREKIQINSEAVMEGVDYYILTHRKLEVGDTLFGKTIIVYSDNVGFTLDDIEIELSNGLKFNLFVGADAGVLSATTSTGTECVVECNGQNCDGGIIADVYDFKNGEVYMGTVLMDTIPEDATITKVTGEVYYLEELSVLPEEPNTTPEGPADENKAEDFENGFKDWFQGKADKLGVSVSELTGYSIGGGTIILFVIAAIVWGKFSGKKRR